MQCSSTRWSEKPGKSFISCHPSNNLFSIVLGKRFFSQTCVFAETFGRCTWTRNSSTWPRCIAGTTLPSWTKFTPKKLNISSKSESKLLCCHFAWMKGSSASWRLFSMWRAPSSYQKAAEMFAQTQNSFEEVALKFIRLQEKEALKTFLLKKLAGLRQQVSESVLDLTGTEWLM